jgi:hypothetical protein
MEPGDSSPHSHKLIEFGVPMKLVMLTKMCLNGTYRKVRIGKYLSDNLSIQNGLKQGNALSPLLFNFDFEYAVRKIQEIQVGLKLNETHQLLVYAGDINLLGDDIDTIKKGIEALIDASKETGLKVNTEKAKYMLLSRHQNAGKGKNINIANRPFENVAKFNYFGKTIRNHDLIHEETFQTGS